eukprot:TRINITY_DN11492_c0_g1_i1.p1 TRINITY_DN11492_c0_g1~~TRINITY_DN11492_c0_g1_i1.p1  ORF type:complete len:252 (-),score=76.37 TRINITY_DN11492_c0_g1_i1:72-827(-)
MCIRDSQRRVRGTCVSLHAAPSYALEAMLRTLCRVRHCSTTATASPGAIYSAALIERRPVILPEPEDFEHRFWAVQQHIKQIRAAPFPDELLANALREQERIAEERRTSDDSFVPAPRRTAADESNDQRSVERALDRTLYLMVNKDSAWSFPQQSVGQGDVLHQAAAKAAEELACPVSFIAQAPIGHVERKDGSKVFYHLAELLPSNKAAYDVSHLSELCGEDFKWLTKEEAIECAPNPHEANVLSILLSE